MNIFHLPSNLSCKLLSSWIDLGSLVRLDTAVRSTKSNCGFRALIHSTEFVFQGTVNFCCSSALKWLVMQGVRVDSFELSEKPDEYGITQYLTEYGSHIRTAKFTFQCEVQMLYLTTIYCKNLATICCSGNHQISALYELLKFNPSIRDLRVEWFDDKDLQIMNLLPSLQLERFSIEQCTNITSFPFAKFVGPHLRALHLEDNAWLQSEDLLSIAGLCSKLKSLALRSMPVCDDNLTAMAALCPCIVNLDLTDNAIVTDAGIWRVVQRLPHLRMITLPCCAKLTSNAVRGIAAHCSGTLANLTIEGNDENVDALADLLSSCPVCALNLTAFTAVTMAGLQNLFANAGRVRVLHLTGTLMSDEVLCCVGKHCHALWKLVVTSGYNTNDENNTGNDDDDNDENDDNDSNDENDDEDGDEWTDFGNEDVNANANATYTPVVVLDAAPCALAYGCPLLRKIHLDNEEVVGSAARRLWNSIRPQLCFSFASTEGDGYRYNICDYREYWRA